MYTHTTHTQNNSGLNIARNLALYELGELSNESSLYLFSDLLRNNHIDYLEAHYKKVAHNLINRGILTPHGDIDEFAAIQYGFNL
jgi:hypothetical protein